MSIDMKSQKGSRKPSKAFIKMVVGLPSMVGKTCAVTGCTTGTGFSLAEVMIKKGARVLCLNRPSSRDAAALEILRQVAKDEKGVEPVSVACDLQSFASVDKAVTQVLELASGGLDVFCCNAGIMHFADQVTEDGFDIQMQVNQLSHFKMVAGLWRVLEKAGKDRGEARVVTHSSQARLIDGKGSAILYPPCFTMGPKALYYEKHTAGGLGGEGCPCPCKGLIFCGAKETRYQQSKLANFVFTYALKDRCDTANSPVKIFCAHPGIATTQLASSGPISNGFVPGFVVNTLMAVVGQSTDDGAQAIIQCCCDRDRKSGEFWGPGWPFYPFHFRGVAKQRKPEGYLVTQKNKDLVWGKCEEACGLKFEVDAQAPAQAAMSG